MATRVITPVRQAWNQGIRQFLKYSWDKEPVLVVSIVTGCALPLAWLVTPKSYLARLTDDNVKFPREYPTPVRYEESKTGPPTSV
ncbi:NADH dehydrogenase [ubiquinone] 1 alpha subcomplex subunit 3-like [Apostichopus japonicus]|uniref:NADH dehydrogenase [ubiquinone] 1 alpha subcomplex subunit 3-like n=1 Tax=Stichopus japonicus TaxID=307972 RepID=UPI003AB34311